MQDPTHVQQDKKLNLPLPWRSVHRLYRFPREKIVDPEWFESDPTSPIIPNQDPSLKVGHVNKFYVHLQQDLLNIFRLLLMKHNELPVCH